MIAMHHQSCEEMRKPYSFMLIAKIDDNDSQFTRQLNNTMRKYKSVVFRWTREYSKKCGYHVQMTFIFDAAYHRVDSFPFELRKLLAEKVESFNNVSLAARNVTKLDGKTLYCHNVKREFNDAIMRATYNAKLDQKTKVTGRSFGGLRVKQQYLNQFP
jgi:hypothetical protein